MTKPKVLLLIDGQGWVLDRLAQELIDTLSDVYEFSTYPYTKITDSQYTDMAGKVDLVHYQNWDIRIPYGLLKSPCPIVISIRSHRFPQSFRDFVKSLKDNGSRFMLHTITPQIQNKFPGSIYIPDPLFKEYYRIQKPFKVGMAYQDNEPNKIYKGYYLVEQACRELGCEFVPLPGNLPAEKMADWYKSINLYVCASVNEAMSTPVMERLALNLPVVTTDVGIPSLLNIHKCERTVSSIKDAISRFYTSPQVLPAYTWDTIRDRYVGLYNNLINNNYEA